MPPLGGFSGLGMHPSLAGLGGLPGLGGMPGTFPGALTGLPGGLPSGLPGMGMGLSAPMGPLGRLSIAMRSWSLVET